MWQPHVTYPKVFIYNYIDGTIVIRLDKMTVFLGDTRPIISKVVVLGVVGD